MKKIERKKNARGLVNHRSGNEFRAKRLSSVQGGYIGGSESECQSVVEACPKSRSCCDKIYGLFSPSI